jgi:uncharacterized cupredoxin-like copper-binding protein
MYMVILRGRERTVVRPGNRRLQISLASVTLVVTLAAMPACTEGRTSHSGTAVSVSLKDFHISASVTKVAGGVVQFRVQNRGPSTHEFLVLRTDLPPDRLPRGKDGLSVDEDSAQLRKAGEITEVPLGAFRTLILKLATGHYVLFCNLEGHYLGGMRLPLQVP